jgi:hypothetical protein
MNMIAHCNIQKQGSVLAYALVIMAMSMVLLTATIQLVVSRMEYAQYREDREQALQMAESGIYFYRWYLAHEVEGKTTQQIQDFWNGSPLGVGTSFVRDITDIDGTIRGSYSVSVTPPEPYSTIVLVESTGYSVNDPDIQRTVRARFRRPSWSEFAVMGNEYMRFGDGTTVSGPLHINGGVHFDGVALNTVSSYVATYYDTDTGYVGWHPGVWTAWSGEYNTNMHSGVFLGGKEYPVSEQSFGNVSTAFSVMQDAAEDSGTYFDDTGYNDVGKHIILRDDGTFRIRTVRSFYSDSYNIHNYSGSWQTYTIPENGIIFSENHIWLEGEIDDERLTLVAADLDGGASPNVFIGNDIRYTNYDGTDILGIAAENDITIMRYAEDDLRIDASLLAKDGRVGMDHYSGLHKDTITVYGSIASYARYGFAYTDGTGYAIRNLQYDNNLLYYPPPYFPTGDKYAIDLWEEL